MKIVSDHIASRSRCATSPSRYAQIRTEAWTEGNHAISPCQPDFRRLLTNGRPLHCRPAIRTSSSKLRPNRRGNSQRWRKKLYRRPLWNLTPINWQISRGGSVEGLGRTWKSPSSSWIAQMEHTLEYRIRERAYEIWNAEGRADGKADEHWLAAEREVLSISARSPAPKASASRKSHKRRQHLGP
jgi:Protein of unknown function (DUF2934)